MNTEQVSRVSSCPCCSFSSQSSVDALKPTRLNTQKLKITMKPDKLSPTFSSERKLRTSLENNDFRWRRRTLELSYVSLYVTLRKRRGCSWSLPNWVGSAAVLPLNPLYQWMSSGRYIAGIVEGTFLYFILRFLQSGVKFNLTSHYFFIDKWSGKVDRRTRSTFREGTKE